MSNAVSILNGASFSGSVKVQDAGLKGMITLRGDLASAKVLRAVKVAVNLDIPKKRAVTFAAKNGAAWMSPDELMLFCSYQDAQEMTDKLVDNLKDVHSMVVNVSDARASFTLTGPGVREVIAKGSPADLSADALPIGEMRRSRLGQVAVAFWLSDAETLHLVCFRSVGAFVYKWLCVAAAKNSLPEYL